MRTRRPPDVEPARPSVLAVLPFGLLIAIGSVPAAANLTPGKGWVGVAAYSVAFVALGFSIASLRRRRHSWVDPMASYLFFLVWMLARDATGGYSSPLVVLLLVPILWLALFGTRRELHVAAVLTAAAFIVPLFLDPATYPDHDVVRAVLWTSVTLLIAPVIQRLVRQLATQTAREQETATKLRAVMEGATLTSMITADRHGVITSVNKGAESLLGYSAAELIGRPYVESIHDPQEIIAVAAQEGVAVSSTVLAHLAHNDSPSRIWRYVRKDGERLFVRLAITVLWGPDRRVLGYLGVAIDGTSAQEASDALAASEAKWRMVINHMPDVTVLVVDEELIVSMIAGEDAELMKKATLEDGRVSLKPITTPQNAALIRSSIAAARAGEETVVDIASSNSDKEFEMTFCLLPHSSHEAIDSTGGEVLGLFRDVTADRARRRIVSASRDRAELLLTSAPHGIAVIRRDATIEQVNPALCRLLGRAEDDLVGSIMTRLPGADRPAITRQLALLAKQSPAGQSPAGAPVHAEWAMRHADGSLVQLDVGSTVIAGSGEEILLTFTDLSERHAHEQELSWLAEHDALTGLSNRRRFEHELGRHLAMCQQVGARGALLMIDLDHFKSVNDTQGHAAGDQLLIVVAEAARAAIRSSDLVARLGGDEFAVLLPDADRLGAEVVAEHLIARIREAVSSRPGAMGGVTASIGIAMVDQRHLDADALMAAADLTMYDAKNGGRDRWAMVGPRVVEPSPKESRRGWSAQLLSAIEDDELELHLQPILDARSLRVTGAEALLRLRDGDRLALPGSFLKQAERTGMIRDIDRWAVERGVATLARLQRLDPDFHLSVNLSGSSLDDPLLEAALMSALQTHRADPSGLVLEVTETRAVESLVAARAFAERITAIGARLALDDFGVGFGSLAYLKHLPFAFLKIDGAFVVDCHRDETDQAIVSSAISLAHRLGILAVAEHVADAHALAAVIEEQVDLVQGYHLGVPLPEEQFVVVHALASQPAHL